MQRACACGHCAVHDWAVVQLVSCDGVDGRACRHSPACPSRRPFATRSASPHDAPLGRLLPFRRRSPPVFPTAFQHHRASLSAPRSCFTLFGAASPCPCIHRPHVHNVIVNTPTTLSIVAPVEFNIVFHAFSYRLVPPQSPTFLFSEIYTIHFTRILYPS